MCAAHTICSARTSAPRRSIERVIAAPPDLPLTTILKVRPGHVVRMHARPGGKLLFRVLPKTIYGRRLILSVTRRRGRVGGRADLPGAQRPARVGARLAPHLRRAAHALAHQRRSQRTHGDGAPRRPARAHPAGGDRRARDADAARHLRRHRQAEAARSFGSSYGCCILALSGHQPKIRTGPIDGRLAIHGTDRPDLVGARVSQGCLRATDRNVRWLMRTVPVGTQVTIRR